MSKKIEEINHYISTFATVLDKKSINEGIVGPYKVGVDLGTANIVITVVDQNNHPVVGALYPASVVKDGLVVDYVGAVKIVKQLKQQIEAVLQVELTHAATAVPPGTVGGNAKAMTNVIEAGGLEVTNVIDEPTAAATVLRVKDGAVVDVGGGTTGISILKNGEVIYTADEPTGGTHMTLVLAGSYNIPFEEAELMKKNLQRHDEVFTVIKPVVEKMASIVKSHVRKFDVNKIFVVGGASCFRDFEATFTKEINIETIKPVKPLLVTPLGIALNSQVLKKFSSCK